MPNFCCLLKNCIKKGGKSAVPSPVYHEPKGAWMFSHVENIGGIQTEETPKINTFQTMRKEVSGMAVFRIEKTRDDTVMSNHHLRNTDLSLKAKGLLSLMLSLPEEWDYTTKGLARICKDGVDSICAGVRELEDHGYVVRERVRNANGQLGAIEYTILEQPRPPEPKREKPKRENPVQANPVLDNPVLGKPEQENPAQLNIDISSNQISKKDLSITQLSNPIQSNPPTPTGTRMGMDGMGAREAYREVILENIGYEYLIEDPKMDREQLDEISKPLIFLSRFAKSVRVQLADIHHAAHKNLPVDQSRPPGEREIKNAATPRKRACSGAFGTPGETRTHYIPLRRRTLYPGEVRGQMGKIFNFQAQQETNQLPLRRRSLYPAELRKHL